MKSHVKSLNTADKVMKRKFLKFENIDFLTYFSSKHRHMTHEVGVACRDLCNCVVRIVNLYGWKGHGDN